MEFVGRESDSVEFGSGRQPRLKPRLGHLSLKRRSAPRRLGDSQSAERRLQPSFFPASRVQWIRELFKGRGSVESDE